MGNKIIVTLLGLLLGWVLLWSPLLSQESQGFQVKNQKGKKSVKKYPSREYTNSIGMRFKVIPPGRFYMGSCKLKSLDNRRNVKRVYLGLDSKGVLCPFGGYRDFYANNDETPQHEVVITKAFLIGVYEVTLEQFKRFIVETKRFDLLTHDFMVHNSYNDRAPVAYVSWDDANDFIRWINKKERVRKYRLPTEAEWEYVTRARTKTIYSWGNGSRLAGRYAWYKKNTWEVDAKYPHQVGTKQPNRWGIYDLHGNVMEWVQDWYDESYYQNEIKVNPTGPKTGLFRSLRGGSWIDDSDYVRTANRYYRKPNQRYFNIGFRLVREL